MGGVTFCSTDQLDLALLLYSFVFGFFYTAHFCFIFDSLLLLQVLLDAISAAVSRTSVGLVAVALVLLLTRESFLLLPLLLLTLLRDSASLAESEDRGAERENPDEMRLRRRLFKKKNAASSEMRTHIYDEDTYIGVGNIYSSSSTSHSM